MVEESARDQTAEAGRKVTTIMTDFQDDVGHTLLNVSLWPAVGQSDEKARNATEGLSFLEATKATRKAFSDETQRAPELPVPYKAPVEQNGLDANNFRASFEFGGGFKFPVKQNGENPQGASEPPAPVEDPHYSGEQNDEKSQVAAEPAALLKVPKPTGETNGNEVLGSSDLPSPMEAPKGVGEQNGQKPGGGPERFGTIEALEAEVESNVQKPRGATEIPKASVEENCGDKEVDDGEKTSTDQNGEGTNVKWELVEIQGVLGPGPLDGEKAAEHTPTATKELHTYFMIKIPKFEEKKLRTEIRMAELRLQEMQEKRNFIVAALCMRKVSRTEALHKLRAAREKVRACTEAIRQKKDEISPLHGALKKLRETGRQARDTSRDLPASEKELDEKIAYYEYRIQHESIPLKEEKLLLREIRNLKASRERVCATEALHVQFSESLGEREDIQERLKPLTSELESLKTEWTLATDASKAAEAEFEEKDIALGQVQDQLTAATQAKQDAYKNRIALMKEVTSQNEEFYHYKREIGAVRQHAVKKEKKDVEAACNEQVERVMGLWNSNAQFRAAYVKSNERSTLKRLQTFDGRALGHDEDPPLLSGDGDEYPSETQMEVQVGPLVGPSKAHREGAAGRSTHDVVPLTVDIERKGKDVETPTFSETNGHFSSSNAPAGMAPFSKGGEEKDEDEDADAAATLKQKRREEEMAKARDAEERKRRAAERLQSKALARAQKEANRQEKEKEKRSQKKAAKLTNASHKATPSAEVGSGFGAPSQEAENDLDVVQEQVPPKSGPISRNPKRPRSQISRTIKAPLVSPVTKKNGLHLPIWFWRVGLVALLGILAVLAIYLF